MDLNELKACLQQIVRRRQEGRAAETPPIQLAPDLEPAAMANKYAAAMLQYIQEHYAQRISLTDLSQELNISCTHLNAKFKAETGYTFHDFLNYYRISKAVELQKQGTYKLYEVAELVGFSDYKYLIRSISGMWGMPLTRFFPQKNKLLPGSGNPFPGNKKK